MNTYVQQRWLHPDRPVVALTVAMVFVALVLVVLERLPIINAILLIPFILGLYAITVISNSRRALLAAVLLPTFFIGFFIAVFRPAGFDYPLVWTPGPLYDEGRSFSLYLNLSKAIGGYLVVIWLWKSMGDPTRIRSGKPPLATEPAIAFVGIGAIILVANIFFGVGWKPKFPDGILYFALVNLLVTVLSEEAFFRLLLQRQVERFFRNKQIGVYAGITIASVLFALAHSGATGMVFFLFLFAGFVYAAIYAWTRSLFASIITHFGVNIVHFVLLEYPL